VSKEYTTERTKDSVKERGSFLRKEKVYQEKRGMRDKSIEETHMRGCRVRMVPFMSRCEVTSPHTHVSNNYV